MPDNTSRWGIETNKKKSAPESSVGRGIFWFMGAILLGVAGAALYYFFIPRGVNVGLEFSKPNQILVGDPFVFSISASNYSDGILKSSKISLFLPEGISFVGQSQSQRVMEQTLGDLGPGSISQQSFNLIVTSGPNSVKHLEAKLLYATASNPRSQFEHTEGVDVLVGQPAAGINITAPQSVFSGQDFEVQAAYHNNTSHDFKNLHLKIDYPPTFQFKRSTVASEGSGNNSWDLGTLSPDSQGTIVITGTVVGQEKSFFSFNASLSADFKGVTYLMNTQSANLLISTAPLSLDVALTKGEDYIVYPGDILEYNLNFKNNSDVVMQNATIKAKLIGEMFDFQKLRSDAAFNSITNTLSWSAANTPALLNIAPGQSGSVAFRVEIKNTYPLRLVSDKNFVLKVQAQIDSPTVPPNMTAEKTITIANSEHKIGGKLVVGAEAYWRDAASGILNSGPYPPKVNQPTQYTIHWKATNYSTDVSNVVVSAYVGSGGKFTGKTKSSIANSPTYDQNSGLVTWSVGSVPATKGVISKPIEAIFQVEVTPAVNQVNQNVALLSETKVEGTDLFTESAIQTTAPALDSSLPYDTTIGTTDRTVKQ